MTLPLFESSSPSSSSPRFVASTSRKADRPKVSRTQLVADYFTTHPSTWIDGLVFEGFAGKYAWSARIRECRRVLKMRIENRVRVVEGGRKVSEYRYLPEPK